MSSSNGRRVALVTGASRGIGRATARLLGRRGHDLVLTARSARAVSELADELARAHGVRAVGRACDVSDRDVVREVYQNVRSEFGRLDALVNNAGVIETAPLGMNRAEDVRRLLDVNLEGVLTNIEFASRCMRSGGTIVNVASVAAFHGRPGQSAYAASKGGVVALTRAVAAELAPTVRVNAVAPGFVETDMADDLSVEDRDGICAEIALGRFATCDEIAECIAFLVSDAAAYVTGQVLRVDGGYRL